MTASTASRFTLDGDEGLESHLGETCARILAGVRGLVPAHRLEAVLLGGGYGRGEGGVMRTEAGDRPYNDLEFYVCLKGNRHLNERRHRLPLDVLGEILTPMAGAEVEFKIISLAQFARTPASMFSYDLLAGHRWLLGGDELLVDCAHHRIARKIPSSEATRLLMNRCSGLLFGMERLERAEFTAEDADFVRRNIAKAELAFGDALLAAFGRYHWSCRVRHRRLLQLNVDRCPSWLDEVRRRHAGGLAFKLHPDRSTESREELRSRLTAAAELGLQVWLWQERRRLGSRFAGPGDYAGSAFDKCPETSGIRNLFVNLKERGPTALLDGNCFRHPRCRVLSLLCSLLWVEEPMLSAGVPHVARATASPDIRARVDAYRSLWLGVN